jgi:hypothetical protein
MHTYIVETPGIYHGNEGLEALIDTTSADDGVRISKDVVKLISHDISDRVLRHRIGVLELHIVSETHGNNPLRG